MNNKKASNNQVSENYHKVKIPELKSFEPSESDIKKMKDLYLPRSIANNKPSEESIEDANGLNYSKPNTLL